MSRNMKTFDLVLRIVVCIVGHIHVEDPLAPWSFDELAVVMIIIDDDDDDDDDDDNHNGGVDDVAGSTYDDDDDDDDDDDNHNGGVDDAGSSYDDDDCDRGCLRYSECDISIHGTNIIDVSDIEGRRHRARTRRNTPQSLRSQYQYTHQGLDPRSLGWTTISTILHINHVVHVVLSYLFAITENSYVRLNDCNEENATRPIEQGMCMHNVYSTTHNKSNNTENLTTQ